MTRILNYVLSKQDLRSRMHNQFKWLEKNLKKVHRLHRALRPAKN